MVGGNQRTREKPQTFGQLQWHICEMHVISDELHVRLHDERPQLHVATKAQTAMKTGESGNSLTKVRVEPTPRVTLDLKGRHLNPLATKSTSHCLL